MRDSRMIDWSGDHHLWCLLLSGGECFQQPLFQSQSHSHSLRTTHHAARCTRLSYVCQTKMTTSTSHVLNQFSSNSAMKVLLTSAHAREALEALSGEDATHDEVAVADMKLTINCQTKLLLKISRNIYFWLIFFIVLWNPDTNIVNIARRLWSF